MSELTAYGHKVTNVFQLIGMLENDITKSIAWGMVNNPKFLKNIVNKLVYKITGSANSNIAFVADDVLITFQVYQKGMGITDLEITDNKNFYFIIEAKKGWALPTTNQLALYCDREKFNKSKVPFKAIVSMSECSDEYADRYLLADYKKMLNDQVNSNSIQQYKVDVNKKTIKGVHIIHLSWKTIYEIADLSKKGLSIDEKKLLDELMEYLGGLMTMQARESNWVYIVALSNDKIENTNITWLDVVDKYNKYFHPFGRDGWPKEPVNYIAFRYNGELKSIHYVEKYVVTDNLHNEINAMPDVKEEPYLVYTLGPAVKPSKQVKTGKIMWATRRWAMFDTLLTENRIYDACELSKKRTNPPNNDANISTSNTTSISPTKVTDNKTSDLNNNSPK